MRKNNSHVVLIDNHHRALGFEDEADAVKQVRLMTRIGTSEAELFS